MHDFFDWNAMLEMEKIALSKWKCTTVLHDGQSQQNRDGFFIIKKDQYLNGNTDGDTENRNNTFF